MAKSKTATPEAKAEQLLKVRGQIKTLQTQKENIVTELRAIVKETGQLDFGGLSAYQLTGIAKFEGLENKALKVAQEQLINELDPTYVKKVLDVSKMYAALQTDKTLLGHLASKHLKIVQGSDIYFKAAK